MTTTTLLDTLTVIAATGCGLIGGCFFAFSTFVMKALKKLPAAEGVAAMQSINVVVINPWFLVPFLGTGLLCLLLAAASFFTWRTPGAAFLAAGAVLYVAGTLLVTMTLNVPLNDALAQLTPTSPGAPERWASYCSAWTLWNHIRTLAALAAAVLLMLAFRLRG
jgi:uncharacterized membrane protein